jgi:RNA polymerase sigma-70 factor (ECF subfamily)
MLPNDQAARPRPDIPAVVEATFRAEHGRVLGALIATLRDFDLAEDALQAALITALERWPVDGVPRNPAAWMTTVARRKAIDRLRRAQALARKHAVLLAEQARERHARMDDPLTDDAVPDERLKLMFTCCHPALAPEAQIALTLRTLGGLTTAEIAYAFLVPLPTMNQRLTRAKNKIRDAGIPFEVPPAEHLAERLAAVQHVLYLIFNEGYAARSGDSLIRQDLCAEALRLARVLVSLLHAKSDAPAEAEALGLLALILLTNARRAARMDAHGNLVLLEDQERALWDREEIAEGLALLDRALAHRQPGPYQVQAAISALHARAASAAETDWRQIEALYEELERLAPSPVVALNRAVATSMAHGPIAGLMALDQQGLDATLGAYHWFHAARADLLRRAGYFGEAQAAYTTALGLCENRVERAFLLRRLDEVSPA